MKIDQFNVLNFRNLLNLSVDPSPTINIFYGPNGSGKTSFLEAIHYLGLGRSFRTRNIRRLINETSDRFNFFSRLLDPSMGTIPVGLERKLDSATIKIAGKTASSLVEVARILPLQLINADSHLLLTSGPTSRRQFLDWGVFHVEHTFFQHWQKLNRIVKQRNACLKAAKRYQEVAHWDTELLETSTWMDNQRRAYVEKLAPLVTDLVEHLLLRKDLNLHYYSGWAQSSNLSDLLKNNFNKDQQLGYTYFGPHRADLQLKIKNVAAVEMLSQGQQKLAAYALRLAQLMFFQTSSNQNCLLLIDDLPSELDPNKKKLVFDLLASIDAQMFITGIEESSFRDFSLGAKTKMFHVEHGNIVTTS